MDFVNLRKTGFGWEFETEADLEDFVWANLQQLLGLTPLKRQHYVNGQFCDILALGDNQQLVVLELKKGEDRYIVQQLTRYFDALLEDKPFKEQVDYQKPISLIAIQASFHRDNFTDRKYSHLPIQFFRYELVADEEKLNFKLKDIETGKVSELEIPFQPRSISNGEIPQLPKQFDKMLINCQTIQQTQILNIRTKILSFDGRMQEIASAGSIKYGKLKNNFCAEICLDSKGQPVLFLWLPLTSSNNKRIGRMKIWTNWDNNTLIEGHVPKGIRTRAISKTEKQRQRERELKVLWSHSGGTSYKIGSKYVSEMEFINEEKRRHEEYQNAIKSRKSLNELVDLALETWLKRL